MAQLPWVELTGSADVARVCRQVAPMGQSVTPDWKRARRRALGEVYGMTLDSPSFALAEFDAGRQQVAVDVAKGLGRPTVGFELVPGSIAGASSGSVAMVVPGCADEAARLKEAHAEERLMLTVWFEIARGGKWPACAERKGAARGVRLAIVPVAFQLKRDDEEIASGHASGHAHVMQKVSRGELQPAEGGREAQGRPVVQVRPVYLGASRGKASERVQAAVEALVPRLTRCYRRGLASDASLRGPLVVGVVTEKRGSVSDARLEVDGVGQPAVTDCVRAALGRARFPPTASRYSVPLLFTRGD